MWWMKREVRPILPYRCSLARDDASRRGICFCEQKKICIKLRVLYCFPLVELGTEANILRDCNVYGYLGTVSQLTTWEWSIIKNTFLTHFTKWFWFKYHIKTYFMKHIMILMGYVTNFMLSGLKIDSKWPIWYWNL